MRWQDVCADPHLSDLPYKIELNEYGNIVMSPQKVYHSILQGKIQQLLRRFQQQGEVFPECAIYTDKGTKVADVVWVSPERYAIIKTEVECSIAPEICIEITSGSNTRKEMDEKQTLYFAQGAKEFWLCDEQGQMLFFNNTGQIAHSGIVPGFPSQVEF